MRARMRGRMRARMRGQPMMGSATHLPSVRARIRVEDGVNTMICMGGGS